MQTVKITEQNNFEPCPHCGQLVAIDPQNGETREEAAENACTCWNATRNRMRKKQLNKAREMVDALFGEECEEKYGVRSVNDPTIAALLLLCTLAIDEEIETAKMRVNGVCTADISIGSKGEIKIKRTEGRSFTEAG